MPPNPRTQSSTSASAATALLEPGKTYYGDCEVVDLTGDFGTSSTVTFKLKILQDVTRPGDPPAGLFTQPTEPASGKKLEVGVTSWMPPSNTATCGDGEAGELVGGG